MSMRVKNFGRIGGMVGMVGMLLLQVAVPASAAVLGPHAAKCSDGGGSSVLVEIVGLKSRTGTVRVQAYGGNPAHYFDKGAWLERIDVPVPATGDVAVCVPLPKPGTYAVSVRHDANGNRKSDKSDGGGMSGNPDVSLTDILFKRKPAPKEVSFSVGQGTKSISVVMNYIQGGSFRPVRMASR